jgi:predicted RNA-binding protein YlqC (UPF0109 family)
MFAEDVKNYAQGIVSGLVDNPDDVFVHVTELSARFVVEIQTNQNDIGQVIGRGGVVIKSIRSLVEAFGGCRQRIVTVDYLTERERPPRKREGI